jgi:multiple sugar transport system ATP-binding protein
MARIELKGLTKSYWGGRGEVIPAVRDLNLTIEPGELIALVGPSGSGKTTVLRLVAGLDDVSSGSIIFNGEVVNHQPPHARDVAMVFQRDALYPHMTVAQNLGFGLRMRKAPNVESRVRETAAMLGLESLLNRMPRELSGGQRQRVALGRAMIRRPAVFLLDEPLTNLDVAMRGQLRREIAMLQRELEVTTIYVTHDPPEAMTLGDRIAVLQDGSLQQVSTPPDLYARPANTMVAAQLGSPPMNLWRGRVLPGAVAVELGEPGRAPDRGPVRVLLLESSVGLLKDRVGQEVLVGARAEHVSVRIGPETADAWRGQVQWREWLGNDMIASIGVGSLSVLVRLGFAAPWEPGTTVAVRPDAAKLHFFDPVNGRRLG